MKGAIQARECGNVTAMSAKGSFFRIGRLYRETSRHARFFRSWTLLSRIFGRLYLGEKNELTFADKPLISPWGGTVLLLAVTSHPPPNCSLSLSLKSRSINLANLISQSSSICTKLIFIIKSCLKINV